MSEPEGASDVPGAADRPPDHPGGSGNGPDTVDNRVSAGQRPVDEQLRRLADLIAASPHNLVARGERPHVFERHVLECLSLSALLRPAGRWLDLGTGGGLPGLVLAIAHPQVAWTLIDATAKKITAVEEFAAALELGNVTAVARRAEALAHDAQYRGHYDGVVTRALAPLPTLVELARGFLRRGGRLVALKGPGASTELNDAQSALERLHLRVSPLERLPYDGRESWVVTMTAENDPPAGYPRRDGVPKSDPLR